MIAKARREKNEKSLADVNIGMLAEGIHMKNKTETRDQVLTVGKFRSILEAKLEVKTEGLKDFVRSTIKGAETGLRKEMQELKYELKGDICKLENRLEDTRQELKDVEGRLSDKIDSLHTRLDEHEAKPAGLAHAH